MKNLELKRRNQFMNQMIDLLKKQIEKKRKSDAWKRQAYQGKCLNCGKTILMGRYAEPFCSRYCATRYRRGSQYYDLKGWPKLTWEDVRRGFKS